MSFGSPTPIEVVVSGPKMADNRADAAKVFEQLALVPSLRDLQYGQSQDYPTLEVRIDREKAALSGVTTEELSRSYWPLPRQAGSWSRIFGAIQPPALVIRFRSKSRKH